MNEEANEKPMTGIQQEIGDMRKEENSVREAMNKDYDFYHNLVHTQQLDETGEKWGVRIGGRLVSDDIFENEEEAKYFIECEPWKIHFAMMCAVAEMIFEQKTNGNKNFQQQNNTVTGRHTEECLPLK